MSDFEGDRLAMALLVVATECEGGRADGPAYDSTLDHLYEVATSALYDYFNPDNVDE